MTNNPRPIIFGEVLYDCFPGGEQVLGGAPFNVAWHLQAFGDAPQFVSRVGQDELGGNIIQSMQDWGMDTGALQQDEQHQTGRVDIELIDDEPHYTITPDCAYDFIDASEISLPETATLLYHGSLGLRNPAARAALQQLVTDRQLPIFMDVNLRPPWWRKDEVLNWIHQASWVKLNHDELHQLGPASGNIAQDMAQFQQQHELEQLIVTRGEAGALVRDNAGDMHSVTPAPLERFVDTVGAGDAFTAVFVHGLLVQWPIETTLDAAQQFASRVVGQRGATSNDPAFYQAFITRAG